MDEKRGMPRLAESRWDRGGTFYRFLSGNRVSIVRNIPNTSLESRVITKPQCLSNFRFELQQGYDLKVQGGSGYSCHTLRIAIIVNNR